MNQQTSGGEGHLDELEMAAYVDRRLRIADRDRVEAHLAGCAECRQEFLEVRGHLHKAARPRWLLAGAGLAAAAGLVLLIRPASVDRMRDRGAPETLTTYGPTGEAALTSLRFVWGATPGATSYRLTVSGASGTPVWSGSVADTVLVLPDSVPLERDRQYFWVADALLEDGTTRSTGFHEFRLVR